MKYIMTKLSLSLLVLLIINGCVSNSHYYVLSNPSKIVSFDHLRGKVIGVENVIVPKYLFKREIAVAKSSSEVDFLSDGVWAEDLNAGLTRRVIAYLQKRFNQPDIYAYPWDLDRQPDIKVKIQVTRFIVEGDRVYLDASWEVKNMKKSSKRAKIFHKSLPAQKGTSHVVEAMDRVFSYLEEDVAKGVKSLR